MATSATIISLDAVRPPSWRNTIKSSLYAQKERSLNLGQLRFLRELENQLMSGAASDRDFPSWLGDRRDRFFEGPQGCISFFYSPTHLKFVLSDFTLDKGGTGGLPCSTRDPYSPRTQYFSFRAGNRRRAAARVAGQVAASLTAAVPVLAWLVEAALRWLSTISTRQPLWQARSALTADLLTMNALLRPGFELEVDALPSWSLLRRFSLSSASLQNRYARAILAGELLCRIGAEFEVDFDTALWVQNLSGNDTSSWRKSLAESVCTPSPVLKNIHLNNRLICQRLLHECMAEVDEFGGPRRIALARTVLSWRLSRHVWSAAEAIRLSDYEVIKKTAQSSRAGDAIIRKFALVTEFVAVSHLAFARQGLSRVGIEDEDTGAQQCGWSPRFHEPEAALFDFDRSATILLRQLQEGLDSNNGLRDDEVAARLAEIAEEILAPMPAAGQRV